MKALITLCVFALSICTAAIANERSGVTEDQKAKVTEMVEQFRRQCIAGPALPGNIPKAMKMMNAWATDPVSCNCSAERLRARLTPEVFGYSKNQMDRLMQQFAEVDVAECGVPVMKEHIAKSCEPFLESAFDPMTSEHKEKRVHELGFPDFQVMIKESCDCIRTTLRDITPSQWAQSSQTRYREYLQRKQAGLATGPAASTPLDEAMGKCMKQKSQK